MPLSEVLKALSDPSRRQIMKWLQAGPRSAGQLADGLNMSKPAVSHHLSVLKSADLVDVEKQGQFQIYTLNATVIEEITFSILDLLHLPIIGVVNEGVVHE